MNILMVHPHDLFDKSESWTIRIRSVAEEFVKKAYKVRLRYFPIKLNEKHIHQEIDSIELIPCYRKIIKINLWYGISKSGTTENRTVGTLPVRGSELSAFPVEIQRISTGLVLLNRFAIMQGGNFLVRNFNILFGI